MTDWLTPGLLARTCRGNLLQDSEKTLTGFSIDTRTLKPGNVFVALQGENSDGHTFCSAAVKAGAAALLVSKETEAPKDVAVIVVTDTLAALQSIANYRRNQFPGKVIAITGSNGKTTTRAMLQHLLSAHASVSATRGNLNNHIGLPLTLLSLEDQSKFAVLEMGMNHLDEIRQLCKIAAPQASLISNIGPAHIGILGSLTNIARAKAEILENLDQSQFAIVPGDTEFTDIFRSAGRAKILTFGEQHHNDYQISNIRVAIDNLDFTLTFAGNSCNCQLHLSGRHNAFNAVAALCMYHQLGFPLEEGCRLLSSFAPVGARMEKVTIAGVNIILDCYNANPASMEEALNFLAICPPERIAVLGDMRELGDLSSEMHEKIGRIAAANPPECLICIGKDASQIATAAIKSRMPSERVIVLMSTDEAAEVIRGKLQKGSTILFKASRGMHFENIVRKIWPELGQDLH